MSLILAEHKYSHTILVLLNMCVVKVGRFPNLTNGDRKYQTDDVTDSTGNTWQ